jgi:hypothetical protein
MIYIIMPITVIFVLNAELLAQIILGRVHDELYWMRQVDFAAGSVFAAATVSACLAVAHYVN